MMPYMCCVCVSVSKANEAVTVDGEVAAILTHSRFKEDFALQPAKVPHQPCGVKPKVSGCFSYNHLKVIFFAVETGKM